MTSVAEVSRDVVDAWTPTRTVRVALAGCGAVGSALPRELGARRDSLERARREGLLAEPTLGERTLDMLGGGADLTRRMAGRAVHAPKKRTGIPSER